VTALAISLAFVAALAFAGFVLWLRTTHPEPRQDAAGLEPLRETVAAHDKRIGELAGRVDSLTLATGMRTMRTGGA
jgi:hypothetical protein